jgi:hypothetical protein
VDLQPGEEVRWRGNVRAPFDQRELVVTDRRLILTDAAQEAVDIMEAAEYGVLLVRSVTLIAAPAGGEPRLDLRAVDPPTFDGIEWPEQALPLIAEQKARAERASAQLRRSLGSIVAITIVGLGVLLVVLVLVLVLT